jgi:Flp pilus assembly protein TadD
MLKFALSLALPFLSACAQFGKPAGPNVQETPPPILAKPESLDSAAIGRIAQAAEQNGGAAVNANALYQQLAARTPRTAEARVALGRGLYQRGSIDLADLAFRDALSLKPWNIPARVGTAQVLLARGQADAAFAEFSAVVVSDPKNVGAINGEGLALDQLNRHPEAQARYRLALDIDPKNGPARNNLGLSLLLSGQRAEAVAVLTPFGADPNTPARYKNNLALAQSGTAQSPATPAEQALPE